MSMIGNFLRISPMQLALLLASPEQISAFIYEDKYHDDPSAEHLDIDKSWQLIHFLLAGDPLGGTHPHSSVVLGGTQLGDEDVGYGPARYLEPDEVREIDGVCTGISEQQLWSRFDEKRVLEADIYPQCWTEGDCEYIVQNFKALKEFYAAAAKSGQAVLQFIN